MPRSRAQVALVGGLLVGGESRRFGSPKSLARWGGRSFAERVAEALASVAPELLLLGSGPVPAELERLPRVADAPGARGPIAGILAALAARPERALLVAACDQPLLSAEALRWLVGRRARGSIATIATLGASGSAAAGRVEPLPGLYEPAALGALEELARAGGSLQPLAGRSDVVVARVPAGLARAWTSVDRPERLAGLVSESDGGDGPEPSTIDPEPPAPRPR